MAKMNIPGCRVERTFTIVRHTDSILGTSTYDIGRIKSVEFIGDCMQINLVNGRTQFHVTAPEKCAELYKELKTRRISAHGSGTLTYLNFTVSKDDYVLTETSVLTCQER